MIKAITAHLHLHEIPGKIVKKGSKALSYRNDLLQTMIALQYTNKQVQYSGQIAAFNINQIPKKTGGYFPKKRDVFESVQEFVYHYENLCHRSFVLREKSLLFINAALKIGYEERDVNFKNVKINPEVKKAKLLSTLDRFDANKSPLGEVIRDRNALTHKLYYGNHVDHFMRPLEEYSEETPEAKKTWFKSWEGEINNHAQLANKAAEQLYHLNHELSEKITVYMK